MFHMKHSVLSVVYHTLSHTCHTCNYHTPKNDTHLKYTLSIWNLFATVQNLCYLDAEENGKLDMFFLFSFILSLVYQGSHLRWWYSTLHIFHHLFMTPLYSHSLPISTKNICRLFFSTPYLEDQSVYLKGEEYPQATQPLMSLITQACPSVWLLVSLTHPNLSITMNYCIIYVS